MASTATCQISELPTEMLVKILSYLDQTDTHFGVALVCKFWLELVRLHLMEKVVVCHKDILMEIDNFPNCYTLYSARCAPKVTKSSCDWNIVAEKSWKFVKTLILIGVGGADLNDIITATKRMTVFPLLF
jgi:hypothetical protein